MKLPGLKLRSFFILEKKFGYSKKEKLKGRKIIQQVFGEGKSFMVFPLKIFYCQELSLENPGIKIGFGAGSRNFKKAVERNRIKRLIREAYRLEKEPLCNYLLHHKKKASVFILYVNKIMPENDIIKEKLPKALQKLITKINDEEITSNT